MKLDDIESHEDAVGRRKVIFRVLSSGDEAAVAVAVQLRNCRKGRRCRSAACSVCHRNHRKNWIRKTDTLMDGNEFTRASLITVNMRALEGKLENVDLSKLLDRVRKHLGRKFGSIRVIGGFDILFQVREGRKGVWQIHLYLLFERRYSKKFDRKIRAAFPPEPTASKPYQIGPVDEEAHIKVASYASKPFYEQSTPYRDKDGHQNQNKKPLKNPQIRELYTWLAKYSAGKLIILKGYRRIGRRIVPIRSV